MDKKLIFRCLSGSRLYGLHEHNSDYDYRGVCVESIDNILGLKGFDQDILPDGDEVIYGIKKFFNLALGNNPNILELLYAQPLFQNEIWDKILEHKISFLSKTKIKNNFIGYAYGQLQKLDRTDTKDKINEDRINLIKTYGYDTKAAMHVIRLMHEALVLLNYGELVFPLRYADFLISIKKGKYKIREIKELFDNMRIEIEETIVLDVLPENSNYDDINNLLKQIYLEHISKYNGTIAER